MMTDRNGLLILGDSCMPHAGRPGYRGIYRSGPDYCEGYSSDHALNQAFGWLCDEGGEDGVVHDVEKCRQIVKLYNQILSPQHFEVIEVAPVGLSPTYGNGFLGYDVALGGVGYSPLSKHLKEVNVPSEKKREWLIGKPFFELLQEFLNTYLNKNGLFNDLAKAKFFLDCMIAMDLIVPAFWESDAIVDYQVISVYEVELTP